MKTARYALGITLFASLVSAASAAQPEVVGWLENVSVHPHQFEVRAKLDTGADNSSVHAENIEVFEENGEQVVAFTMRNREDETIRLKRPLLRYTHIKSKVPGAEPIQRPVVELSLCLGDNAVTAPVNLANRENFNYRMLIGRSYLKKGYLIDSNNTYTSKPECSNNKLISKS